MSDEFEGSIEKLALGIINETGGSGEKMQSNYFHSLKEKVLFTRSAFSWSCFFVLFFPSSPSQAI